MAVNSTENNHRSLRPHTCTAGNARRGWGDNCHAASLSRVEADTARVTLASLPSYLETWNEAMVASTMFYTHGRRIPGNKQEQNIQPHMPSDSGV
ncbi:hypothetical protein SLA2020_083300 [Shorea laevis]